MRASLHLALALGILFSLPATRAAAQNGGGVASDAGANGSPHDRARRDERRETEIAPPDATGVGVASRAEPADRIEARLALDGELRSIHWESRHATRLYIASSVLFVVGGLVTGVGYVIYSFFSSLPSGGAGLGLAALTLGSAVGLVSLVTFACAIGFDVDSGSRRGGFEGRHAALATTRLSVSPIEAGVVIGLGGAF